ASPTGPNLPRNRFCAPGKAARHQAFLDAIAKKADNVPAGGYRSGPTLTSPGQRHGNERGETSGVSICGGKTRRRG
ncbi:MAG TPA: hypothetical protein PKE65_07095, partial [Rhizobiaceae bacterium]|nr:hypothetical protein [Rhizobiaceae bacterium]